MAVPVVGEPYSVVDGDRLWWLARDVYGTPFKYPLIVDANPQINGRGLAPDGSPLIFEGDVLWIPAEESEEIAGIEDSLSFASQQQDSYSVRIGGELVAVLEGELLLTMDTGSDVATFSVDVDSLSDRVREALRPFRYPDVTVRINGELKLTGRIYVVEPSNDGKRKIKKLTAYSKTADLIDSSVNPPYEVNSVSLVNYAKALTKDVGISAVFYSGENELFDRIRPRSGEKRYSHLVSLAKERGLLVSCTAYGNILFHTASDPSQSVDVLEEGKQGVLSWSGQFDGRKRFSSYRIVGKGLAGEPVAKTVVDPFVKPARYFARKESRSDAGSAEKAAQWERSKAIADALSINLSVDSWRTRSNELWRDNTFVTVKSETLDIPDGVDLLIRRVKFVFSPSGKTAVLSVVPREVFTGEPIPDIWA